MSELYVGIMSGTSLDGIDIALTSFCPATQRCHLVGALCVAFPAPLRNDLLLLCQPGANELQRAGTAGQQWARLAASGIERLLRQQQVTPAQVTAIGSHGQTIRHHPDEGFSIQIGAPALLAELSGIDVICDFRSRDLAAGGEGAPLVPAFHQWLLGNLQQSKLLINIGGFANLTLLGSDGSVTGFDSGPGNVLLDYWAQQHTGQAFDEDGNWAASGQIIPSLLESLLQDPYFSRAPPKSTGREYFNPEWLQHRLAGRTDQAVDIQATLAELTALSIVTALEQCMLQPEEIYICGGGARNGWLMARLQQLLAPKQVQNTAELGVDADWMEAIAFAWLAWRCNARLNGNLPAVTGARGERILGAIYPA